MAELLEEADTGRRDALGNRVRERAPLGRVRVRVAPSNLLLVTEEGNAHTQADLTLVTTAPMDTVSRATLLVIAGGTYEVTQRTDLGRRRALSCSRRKGA